MGTNRATASLDRLKERNPMVEVTADEENLDAKDKDYFRNFDVVIVTNYPKDVVLKVNKFCRELNLKFFAGDIFGSFGYSFTDIVDHEYVEEEQKVAEAKDDAASGEPKAKKAKVDEEPEVKMVKKTMKFVPMEDALKVDWSADSYKKRLRRMDPSFFILQVIVTNVSHINGQKQNIFYLQILLEFQSREGCSPRFNMREEDLKLLKSLRESITSKYNLADNKIPEDIIPMLFSELSPVAAIVGGILGQEVIKVISNKDAPLNNFFLFNPLESAGVVETIGY